MSTIDSTHVTLREYLDDKFDMLHERIQSIEQHLAKQNGRIATAEQKVAVLESQAGRATTFAAALAAILVALFEGTRWLLSR